MINKLIPIVLGLGACAAIAQINTADLSKSLGDTKDSETKGWVQILEPCTPWRQTQFSGCGASSGVDIGGMNNRNNFSAENCHRLQEEFLTLNTDTKK